MSSKTPWPLRENDPIWRNDHDYSTGAIRTGSDGAMYTALKPSGPNTEAGAQDPTKSSGYWESIAASLMKGGSNAISATDLIGSIGSMTGATADKPGTGGFVPAPDASEQNQYLRGDGTWQTPTDNKVTQTVTTTNDDYPILTTSLADATATRTEGVRFSTKCKVNHSTGTITATTFKGAVSGNASTASSATKLATKRSINGMQFDGSSNIFNYGTCSTAAGTAAKTVALSGFALATGATVWVKFSAANTHASPTLNVNGTGAKSIRYLNAALPDGMLQANGIYQFIYDGTYWQLVSGGSSLATIDPWDIFPMYVPINVFGVKFGGSDGRRAIMPGESTARENWVICDGGSDGKGGTVPDIRGRFIMGASDEYKAGSTGGSKTHSHTVSGTVAATTLSEAQMPSHKHKSANEDTFVSGGGNGEANILAGPSYRSYTLQHTTNAVGGSYSHAHSINTSTTSSSNMQPFYALSFIMRCA